MSHAAFPVDADISAFVAASGVTAPSGFSFTGLGAFAQREFERRTERVPFLKDGSDVVRTFDPAGGKSNYITASYSSVPLGDYGGGTYLELDAGLLSLTSIYKDVTAATPSGTALVQGTDFILLPVNAPARSEPWTAVQILRPFWGQRNSVQITGKWGYSDTVPEDVWQACLAIGAGQVATALMESQTAGGSYASGEEKVTLSGEAQKIGQGWAATAERVIQRYKLVRWGL